MQRRHGDGGCQQGCELLTRSPRPQLCGGCLLWAPVEKIIQRFISWWIIVPDLNCWLIDRWVCDWLQSKKAGCILQPPGCGSLIRLLPLEDWLIALCHTSYLSFFLHEQNFWRVKFTPKKRVNYDKIHSKVPIFCFITAKYTVNCQFFALNL